MEDHDYAKVIIGEYPYEDPNKPVRQYEGPTDPSLPPHLLTPVLQSFAPTTQLVIKESVGLGQNAHAQSTAALLQQKLSLTQLLQNAQQHKLVLFNQTRSDQSANQPQTKKAKQTDQSSASGSTSAQLPIALFSQPPVGIPLSHLIPIPANMAQQLIASGRVQLQGPTGPVTVQALKVGTSVEKGETQEKKDTVKSEKESSEENKSKTDEKNVANRSEENENHPTSGGRSTRSSYKIPKKSGSEKKRVISDSVSARLCLCSGCNNPAKRNDERGPDFCSNECVVKHCKMVFKGWVAQQRLKAT